VKVVDRLMIRREGGGRGVGWGSDKGRDSSMYSSSRQRRFKGVFFNCSGRQHGVCRSQVCKLHKASGTNACKA
jgi:hypothetical protein